MLCWPEARCAANRRGGWAAGIGRGQKTVKKVVKERGGHRCRAGRRTGG
ncbi:hypothetical protein [Eikenella corrodens]|nr:hypothetical protein [Eikenella corrodens]